MPIDMPKSTKKGGFGEKVETVFVRFLLRCYNATIGALSKRIRDGVDNWTEDVEQATAEIVRPLLDDLLSNPDLPTSVRALLERAARPQKALGMALVIMVVSALASAVLPPLIGPMAQRVGQWGADMFEPALPDIYSAATMMHRGQLSEAEFKNVADFLGHRDHIREAVIKFTQQKISPEDFVRHAYLAGLSEGGVSVYLQGLGYQDAELVALMNIYQLRPGPSDLVRMGVREAWRDDVAARWGYDSDFPAQFGAEMQRAGDTEGWAKRYWRAHWELPSITLVLEMLHRGVVSDAEFDEYLRIADYPSGWRDRIGQVAYTPYTRVDTRRMYRFGVLDEAGVYETYRDIGYDHEHATAMTQFTVLDALTEERELTKADVLKSYRLGRFTQAAALANLITLGYNETVGAMLLSNVDQAQADAQISGVVSNTHSLYIRGGITRAEVITRLAVLNLASSEVERYFELWDLEKESRVALPTRSALDGFLSDDIITVDQYQAGLTALSYQTEAVEWYTQAVVLDKAARAERERERATNEAEKVAAREVTTEYQRAKALLTVDLREVEARIGELQTAIQARALSYRDDVALARQRLTVAQITADHDSDRAELQERLDGLSIENREYRQIVDALQTDIAALQLALEETIDATLQETARLQIAELAVHRETIQTILAEGRAEIARLAAEVTSLVDPTLTQQMQTLIAARQTEIEARQDTISGYQVTQATIKRRLLEAGVDEVQGLKEQHLDLQIFIAGERLAIDELQTLIAGLREANIDPALALALHSRQELIAELRANNAEGAVIVQEIDESVTTIRLARIDPEATAQVESLRERILTLRIQIERVQDAIAANLTMIIELQSGIRRLREMYRKSLSNLQRVVSLEAVDASYRADLETLQAELATARTAKNQLRVQLAQVRYEYTV